MTMEPINAWMEIFTRAREADDKEALARIFKGAPSYLRNVCDGKRETVLEILFDRKKGLFKFIETILSLKEPQITAFNNQLIECFNALQFIMIFFKQDYNPYIMRTRNICFSCITTCCSYDVRKVASETLSSVIILFNNNSLNLDEIVNQHKEGSILYIVLGAIARYCPEIINKCDLADTIFLKLLYDLQYQCKLSKKQQQKEEIKIYLQCLTDMMVNFMPYKSDTESLYHQKLYNFFLLLCEDNNSPEIIFKTVYLLSTHMQSFSSFIFKDYNKWHNLFDFTFTNIPNSTAEDVLRTFYKFIPLYLLQEYRKDVFLYFQCYFMKNITNANLSPTKLGLIIYGLGQLSVTYTKYSPGEINNIFKKIAHQTSSSKKNTEDQNNDLLPHYLQALSEILIHMRNISYYHLNIVTEISILIIKIFPQLKERNQTRAINAFKLTFVNVNQLEKKYQWQYFHTLFYEGIFWSCSQALYIDIELQQEFLNLSELPISYKNYVSLWQSLFKLDCYQEDLGQQIFYELLSVFILFIEKLNLNIKLSDCSSDEPLSFVAEKEANFRYFINLVDLYVEVFEKIEMVLLEKQTEKFLTYCIKCSYKYPMVSGFYKLMEVIFRKLDASCDYKVCFTNNICELIPQFLLDVLQLIDGFSGELQLTCIYLIFNAPLCFIIDVISETIPLFEIAFKIGLSDFSLAFCALETLEFWTNSLENQCLKEFCKNVIFYLEPYLQNEENVINIYEDIVRSKKEMKIKNTIISIDDKSYKALQNKILLFYGSINYNVLLDFVHENSLKTDASWNKKNLTLELLFSDTYLEVTFNKFIPRIVELINSDNQRTKFSACELLHTIITIVLGKKLMDQYLEKNLYFTILKLGSDSNDAFRNLYHPLVKQLTHYLSSKLLIESRLSREFLDALFEGLTNEFDPIVRDYCGTCIKEFVQWMKKQSCGNDPLTSSHIKNIVRRIINIARHPSKNKRLAAVIAFNYLYRTLKEYTSLINLYWLEFLYAFVKILEDHNDVRIIDAVNNVISMLENNVINMLNAKCSSRRRPLVFSNETLKSATIWLFEQCSSVNTEYRHKCMELVEHLCVLIPGNKSVAEFVRSCGIDHINRIALENLEKDFECITINNTKVFLTSLDFYIWIFNKKFVSPNSILLVENCEEGRGVFFQFFTKFVSIIINENIREIAKAATSTWKEAEELIDLINKVILKIFNFLSAIVLAKESVSAKILEYLWTDSLYLLISCYTLWPRQIGLTAKNLEIYDAQQLESWFGIMMTKLPESYLKKLQDNFFNKQSAGFINFVDMYDIINLNKDVFILKDFVRGVTILRNCKFTEFRESVAYWKEKITYIYEVLKTVVTDGNAYEKTKTQKDYLKDVMQFFLLQCGPELIETLINLVVNGISVTAANGSALAHRELFVETFKTPIFRYILKDPSETLQIIDKTLSASPDKLFSLLEDLLSFARSDDPSNSVAENLAYEVIDRCDVYRKLVTDADDGTRARLFCVNRLAVGLLSNPRKTIIPADAGEPRSGLYSWILEEFERAGDDLEAKSCIIESFLSCMADETSVASDLLSVFLSLRDEDSASWVRLLESNVAERLRVEQCLGALLKSLVLTKTCYVLEGIVWYIAGACRLFPRTSIAEPLMDYFTAISAESVSETLQVLQVMFVDTTLSTQQRLDILDYFLLPALEFCRMFVVKNFYAQYAQDLANLLTQEISECVRGVEIAATLVTKIGCFKLFELMFGKTVLAGMSVHMSDLEEALDVLLMKQALEIRTFAMPTTGLKEADIGEMKELTRLLHCAAFNCCIVIVSLRGNEVLYDEVFREARSDDRLIWTRIVDCERTYEFQGNGPTRFRKRLVNVREAVAEARVVIEPDLRPYLRRCDPTDYDPSSENEDQVDGRQRLSFEVDALNDHECVPMITGLIICFFNAGIARLPEINKEISDIELPQWLQHFCKAIAATEACNVSLFFMRIISNVKKAFAPYLRSLFVSLSKATRTYLAAGNALNYLVRDMLLIIIESELQLRTNTEVDAAQALVEVLIERTPDPCDAVYKYNEQLLENLVSIWREELKVPRNLEEIIRSNGDLAMRNVLMLFRHRIQSSELIALREVHALVRRAIFRWQEPITPQAFETLGWIMQNITDEQRDDLIKKDLIDLFIDVQRYDANLCTRLVYLTFVGCPSIGKCEELWQFMDPRVVNNDERKAECCEMFLEAMTDLELSAISARLKYMDLRGLLRNRVLPCVDVGFRIVDKLLSISCDAGDLLPYAQMVEIYTRRDALLEHKKMSYGFFVDVYEKYEVEEAVERDEARESLMKLCNNILVAGVSDPCDEIQDGVLSFWKERTQLLRNCSERLAYLFEIYSHEMHSSFAQFIALLMLDLATNTANDQKKLFQLLTQDILKEYDIVAPRCKAKRRKRRRIPPFVLSLAGLHELAFAEQADEEKIHSNERTPNSVSSLELLNKLIRPSLAIMYKQVRDPSENQLSKRCFLEQPKISSTPYEQPYTACPEIDEYFEKLKKETENQRDNIKINRKYRMSSYPDVELTQSAIVATLEDFARRDRRFAEDFVISIVCALISRLKDTEMYSKFINAIARASCRILQVPGDFALVAIEILILADYAQFNADDVMKVAKFKNAQSLGILLFEKDSINRMECPHDTQAQKKLIILKNQLQHRFQLANLYQSIGEHDVVRSIFKNWMLLPTDSDNLRKGYLSETEDNWLRAKISYEQAYEDEFGIAKDYCLENIFRCLSELSSWMEINKRIYEILNKDYNSIWQHPKRDELLPWIFTAQQQKTLDDITTGRIPNNQFFEWATELTIGDQGATIASRYGEELSTLYLCVADSPEPSSRRYLQDCLEALKDEWISSKSYNRVRRLRMLEKLARLNDSATYLGTIGEQPMELATGARRLIRLWEENSPGRGDKLLNWSMRVNLRLAFACLLIERLKNDNDDSRILNDLVLATLNQRLKISDLALENRNKVVARKYNLQIQRDLNYVDTTDNRLLKFKHDFSLAASRYKFICGETENDVQKKFLYHVDSWQLTENLINKENIDLSTRIKAKRHMFDVTSAMCNSMKSNLDSVYLAMDNEFMFDILNVRSREEIEDSLYKYCYDKLNSVCKEGSGEEMADSYLKFIEFCHDVLSERYDRNSEMRTEFNSAVLTAMSLGSPKAARYFLCLLKYSIYQNNEQAAQLFVKKCQEVPSWMFLPWQDQIVSHLATPLAPFIVPVVDRLAKDFPNAILYSLREVFQMHPELRSNPTINCIYDSLFADQRIDRFFNAIKYLCQPEQYLKHHLLEFTRSIKKHESFTEIVDFLLNKFFVGHEISLQGPIFKQVLDKYRADLEQLKTKVDHETANMHIKQICEDLNEAMRTRLRSDKSMKSSRLYNYSTYLNDFMVAELGIEVPGQYSRFGKPLPSYHAKIAKIDAFVEVIASQRSPVKICIIGTNAKTYDFVVQFGVNVRQNQRMQRIFEIANETLRIDATCNKRYLFVNTYNVIPLSSTLGLVHWVKGMKSLKEFIEFAMTDKSILTVMSSKYHQWMEEANAEKVPQKINTYKQALLKYGARNVVAKMKDLIGYIDSDLLRKTFIQISPSFDCFMQLRQNFITSYATMCVVHWLTGVGDRRLKNTLIEVQTGRCFGVNFAMVFGAGVDQSIPELTPFRLTPQILDFLKPFREGDLFGITMSHVLRALKNERNLILTCLDVFMHEPLTWNQQLNERLRCDDDQNKGARWLPRKRIAIVKKKLGGVKPSKIMLEELAYVHDTDNDENQYFEMYKHVVNGNELYHTTARSFVKTEDLTPEEQVQCLLDQATDLNILGRMSVDWCPYL